jgi:hypothetical protein
MRQIYFDELAQDSSTLFQFFYSNNEIFNEMHVEDVERLDVLNNPIL